MIWSRNPVAIRHGLYSTIALLLLGCSNEQIYNAVQENQQMECSKLPQNQFEECVRNYDTPYAEYERARESAIKDEAAQ